MRQKFINAVNAGDLFAVRISLSNELLLDPRGATFDEMLHFAEQRIADLYEPDDGRTRATEDPQTWNQDLLNAVKNDLDRNFSRERVALYRRMAPQVLREKAERLNREQQAGTDNAAQLGRESRSEQAASQNNRVYTGVTVGGALLTVTGLVLERAALASLGAVGMAIGGYLLYQDLKKR